MQILLLVVVVVVVVEVVFSISCGGSKARLSRRKETVGVEVVDRRTVRRRAEEEDEQGLPSSPIVCPAPPQVTAEEFTTTK